MALASDRPLQPISLNFDEFLARYGDDSRYELIDGERFDLEPTGPHGEVAATIARWLNDDLNYDIVQQGADYFIPHRGLIKPLANQTGFRPDVIVLDRAALSQEPLWASQPVVTLGSTIPSLGWNEIKS